MRESLAGRLAELAVAIRALEDERAEAMLRTAVGEFDGDRWEQVRQDVEGRLAALTTDRAALDAEIGEINALLDSAGPVESEVEPSVQPAAAAATEPAPAPEAAPALMASEMSADAAHAATHAAMDEGAGGLLDLDGIGAPVESPSAEVLELDRALELLAPDTPATGSTVALDGLNGLAGAPAPSEMVEDVFGDAALPSQEPVPVPGWGGGAPAAGNAASADAFDDLAFLRSVIDSEARAGDGGTARAEAAKTLRCTECGTMNFPTEWYCERCGGELAAF
jgi:hypothetical protein